MTGFDEFWNAYPRKVGKLAAQKAYTKARGSATQSELLAGVASYMRHKPQYADYCHPATWLNQGRWMDEYETPRSVAVDWWDECKSVHGGSCNGQAAHRTRCVIDAGRAHRT